MLSRYVQSSRLAWRMALSLPCVLLLMASDCKKPLPPSDSTPPVLTWSVHNGGSGQTQTFTGNGKITAKPGESFTVTLIAEDPEGVSRIELGGAGSYSCVQGNVGQNTTIDQKTDVQTLQPDADGKVLTKIFLIRDVDPNGWTCQSGFSFTGGSLTLQGRGDNYHNGITKGSLTITR